MRDADEAVKRPALLYGEVAMMSEHRLLMALQEIGIRARAELNPRHKCGPRGRPVLLEALRDIEAMVKRGLEA